MGWSKAKNVHAISRFREEISWNQFKLLHTITKFEKTLKYTFLFFLLRNASFFLYSSRKKSNETSSFSRNFHFARKNSWNYKITICNIFVFWVVLEAQGLLKLLRRIRSSSLSVKFGQIKAKIKACSHIKQSRIFTKKSNFLLKIPIFCG